MIKFFLFIIVLYLSILLHLSLFPSFSLSFFPPFNFLSFLPLSLYLYLSHSFSFSLYLFLTFSLSLYRIGLNFLSFFLTLSLSLSLLACHNDTQMTGRTLRAIAPDMPSPPESYQKRKIPQQLPPHYFSSEATLQ